MTLPLANEPTEISHGSSTVRLRPSLRAAYLLERKYGLQRLYHGVSTGHCGIVLDILQNTADDHQVAVHIFDHMVVKDGVVSIVTLSDPLITVLNQSFGIDPDQCFGTDNEQEKNGSTTSSFELEKVLFNLFQIGTGWLGWTPSETWSATPAEIMAARDGLIAKLKAIHCSADDQDMSSTYDPAEEISPDQLQENLARLRSLSR